MSSGSGGTPTVPKLERCSRCGRLGYIDELSGWCQECLNGPLPGGGGGSGSGAVPDVLREATAAAIRKVFAEQHPWGPDLPYSFAEYVSRIAPVAATAAISALQLTEERTTHYPRSPIESDTDYVRFVGPWRAAE